MKANILLAVFVLAALSSAQYVQRPEETEPIRQQETTTVETGSPQTTDLEPTDQGYQQPTNTGQQSGVDEQGRLRQEKALRERDREWFQSVLDSPGMVKDHGSASKKLAKTNNRLAVLEKKLNDLANETRRGLNKHRQEIDALNKRVDDIWGSEEAKALKSSLKKELLSELAAPPEDAGQEVADTQEKGNTFYWIVGVFVLALVVLGYLMFGRKPQKETPEEKSETP